MSLKTFHGLKSIQKNIHFDKLGKLVALLPQNDVVLTSLAEMYALQVARSSSEIQTLLTTQFPQFFTKLAHRIFNASNRA